MGISESSWQADDTDLVGASIADLFIPMVLADRMPAGGVLALPGSRLAALAGLVKSLHARCGAPVCRRRALLAQLAERERLAGEVHDAMLQGMQGILLSFQSVGQRLPPGSAERVAIEHLLDQGDAALAECGQRLQAWRRSAGDSR